MSLQLKRARILVLQSLNVFALHSKPQNSGFEGVPTIVEGGVAAEPGSLYIYIYIYGYMVTPPPMTDRALQNIAPTGVFVLFRGIEFEPSERVREEPPDDRNQKTKAPRRMLEQFWFFGVFLVLWFIWFFGSLVFWFFGCLVLLWRGLYF